MTDAASKSIGLKTKSSCSVEKKTKPSELLAKETTVAPKTISLLLRTLHALVIVIRHFRMELSQKFPPFQVTFLGKDCYVNGCRKISIKHLTQLWTVNSTVMTFQAWCGHWHNNGMIVQEITSYFLHIWCYICSQSFMAGDLTGPREASYWCFSKQTWKTAF